MYFLRPPTTITHEKFYFEYVYLYAPGTVLSSFDSSANSSNVGKINTLVKQSSIHSGVIF